MGAFILSGGAKGKRYALPNAEVMIHQPLGSTDGQATDIMIAADHIVNTKHRLNKMLAANTGRAIAEIEADCDRNKWLCADEAVSYGLVDRVISTR